MKWKGPNNGETRIIKKFAFFPMWIGNECRWLETVYLEQAYYYEWYNYRWVAKQEYLDFKKK